MHALVTLAAAAVAQAPEVDCKDVLSDRTVTRLAVSAGSEAAPLWVALWSGDLALVRVDGGIADTFWLDTPPGTIGDTLLGARADGGVEVVTHVGEWPVHHVVAPNGRHVAGPTLFLPGRARDLHVGEPSLVASERGLLRPSAGRIPLPPWGAIATAIAVDPGSNGLVVAAVNSHPRGTWLYRVRDPAAPEPTVERIAGLADVVLGDAAVLDGAVFLVGLSFVDGWAGIVGRLDANGQLDRVATIDRGDRASLRSVAASGDHLLVVGGAKTSSGPKRRRETGFVLAMDPDGTIRHEWTWPGQVLQAEPSAYGPVVVGVDPRGTPWIAWIGADGEPYCPALERPGASSATLDGRRRRVRVPLKDL